MAENPKKTKNVYQDIARIKKDIIASEKTLGREIKITTGQVKNAYKAYQSTFGIVNKLGPAGKAYAGAIDLTAIASSKAALSMKEQTPHVMGLMEIQDDILATVKENATIADELNLLGKTRLPYEEKLNDIAAESNQLAQQQADQGQELVKIKIKERLLAKELRDAEDAGNIGWRKAVKDKKEALVLEKESLATQIEEGAERKVALDQSAEYYKNEQKTRLELNKRKDLMEGFTSIFGKSLSDVKALGKTITGFIFNPLTAVVAVGGFLVNQFVGMFKSTMKFQKELGIGAGHGMALSIATREASAGAFMYGENMEDVRARTTELVKEWGDVNSVTQKEISLANELERTYGTSAGAVAQLTAMMESTSSASKEVLMKDMAEEMKDMQDSGVPVGVVMEEIAGNTDFFAKHMKKGGKNVIKAAAFAKKLGMSMDTIAGAADSLLDVESSINAEMEASVLLGRSVNMDEARRLALAGDLEGMQRAIMDQVGSEGDYLEMNVVQRQALAEAAGISVTDLSKMVSAQEKLANMSEKDKKANEKKANATAKIKKIWEKVVGIFKTLYQRLVTPIMKAFMKLLGISGDLAGSEGLGGVAEIGKKIEKWLEPMIVKFEGWLAGSNEEGGSFATTMVGIKDTAKMLTGILGKITTFLFEHQEIVAVLAGGWVANKLGLLAFVKGAIMGIGKYIGQLTAAWLAKKLLANQPMDSKKAGGGGMKPAKMMAAGVAMVLFAGAIWIMAKAMQQFSTGVSWEGVAMGLVTLAALTIAGIALGLSAPVTIVGAAAMVILAAAFVVMSIGAIGFAFALSLLTPLLTAFFDGIALIISAIAGAFVKMLTAVAETFERLAKIGGGQLLGTAAGILAIAAALLVFGGGSLLGGIASGLGKMFGGDPVKKFERFAAMAPGLMITATAMKMLSKGMKMITSMNLDDVIDPLAEFTSALMGGGMMSLGAMFGGGPMEKIEKFSELGPGLKITGSGLKNVADSIKFIDGPGLIKASVGIDKLGKALFSFGMGGAVAGIGSAIGSLFGQDPIKKFEKFGELGPELKVTAVAMQMLSDSMKELESTNLGKLVDPTLRLAGAFQNLASSAREVNRATVASMALGVVSTIGSAIKGSIANIASLIGIVEQKKDSKIVADPVTAAKLDKVISLLSNMPTDENQMGRSRKEISAMESVFANK